MIILDLNANGITSEFIYNTNTHDGLLALDKNQDGIINSGNELFGNYSKLQNAKEATDRFNALSDYDTNNME